MNVRDAQLAARAEPRRDVVARVSPLGKFSDDVVGFACGVGVSEINPGAVCLSTVRLPVTAAASAGTLVLTLAGWRPVTWKVLGVLLCSGPVRPRLNRVSRIRFGVNGT